MPLVRQLLPALDHIELAWRTDFANGDKEAALVITGEREKNKFFSYMSDTSFEMKVR